MSFTKDSERRIAYSASFGHTDISHRLESYYKKWLSRYKYIAVREDSAVEIINNLGLEAYQVIDPTLLLDADYWSRFQKPIKYSKYILVYQLHNDKRLGKYAQNVARETGLPLIRISTSFHQITREGKFIYCPESGEFLSYIRNATCIITDSFHGTAFAINYNTLVMFLGVVAVIFLAYWKNLRGAVNYGAETIKRFFHKTKKEGG